MRKLCLLCERGKLKFGIASWAFCLCFCGWVCWIQVYMRSVGKGQTLTVFTSKSCPYRTPTYTDINAHGQYTLPYTPIYIPYHYKTPDTLATNRSMVKNHTVAINLFLNVHPCFLSPIKMAGVSNNVIIFVFIGLYLFGLVFGFWFIPCLFSFALLYQ